MIRTWLSFSISGLVLLVGTYAACVQSDNFARAARLHELQLESDWYVRRATQLRVELERERFEFSAPRDASGVQPSQAGEVTLPAARTRAAGEGTL